MVLCQSLLVRAGWLKCLARFPLKAFDSKFMGSVALAAMPVNDVFDLSDDEPTVVPNTGSGVDPVSDDDQPLVADADGAAAVPKSSKSEPGVKAGPAVPNTGPSSDDKPLAADADGAPAEPKSKAKVQKKAKAKATGKSKFKPAASEATASTKKGAAKKAAAAKKTTRRPQAVGLLQSRWPRQSLQPRPLPGKRRPTPNPKQRQLRCSLSLSRKVMIAQKFRKLLASRKVMIAQKFRKLLAKTKAWSALRLWAGGMGRAIWAWCQRMIWRTWRLRSTCIMLRRSGASGESITEQRSAMSWPRCGPAQFDSVIYIRSSVPLLECSLILLTCQVKDPEGRIPSQKLMEIADGLWDRCHCFHDTMQSWFQVAHLSCSIIVSLGDRTARGSQRCEQTRCQSFGCPWLRVTFGVVFVVSQCQVVT